MLDRFQAISVDALTAPKPVNIAKQQLNSHIPPTELASGTYPEPVVARVSRCRCSSDLHSMEGNSFWDGSNRNTSIVEVALGNRMNL